MKKFLSVCTLLTSLCSSLLATHVELSTPEWVSDQIQVRKTKKCCDCTYKICSKQINKGTTFIIDKPGVWCLDGDAVFNPKPSKYAPPDPRAVQAAIKVLPGISNVTIDLGNYTLSQAYAGTSSQVPFVVGILVPNPNPKNTDPDYIGAHSIYIQGDTATIDGFSMYGVRIFANIADIQVENITIENCGALASRALRPTVYGYPYIPHDQYENSNLGPASFAVAGISIGEMIGYGEGPQFFTAAPYNQLNIVNRTNSVRIANVNALHNFSFGGMLKNITNLTIDNSHFDYTWSDDPGAFSIYSALPAYGVLATGIVANAAEELPTGNTVPCNENVYVVNSTFNNSSINGDYLTPLISNGVLLYIAAGYVDSSTNSTFINSQFNNSSCTFPNAVHTTSGGITNGATAKTFGFVGLGIIQDANYINCNFDGAFNLGRALGYSLLGEFNDASFMATRNIKMVDCTANNIQCRIDQILPAPILSTSTVQAFALTIGVKDVYMENCQASDILVIAPSAPTGSTTAAFSASSSASPPSFFVPQDSENFVFKNCTSARLRTLDGGTVWGWSFFVSPTTNIGNSIIHDGCISTGNQALLSSVYPTWSAATTYNVGAQASEAGVNYVSLINSNTGNNPSTTPTDWSVVNNAPAAWSVTATYGLGALISFTNSTGHTNEYISTISGNVGNYPNAPGPGEEAIPNWVQTNFYPTWNSAATYQVGSLIALNGINYRSLVYPNVGNNPATSPTDWSATTTVVQTTAGGFLNQQNSVAGVGGPSVYQNCISTQHVGAPGPITQSGVKVYSAGFLSITALGTVYNNCKSNENVYGFLLENCVNCFVYKNEAINNGIGGIGEGFTDVGATGTAAAPTQSFSVFEGNTAFNNGYNATTGIGGTLHVGSNQNYNIWVDAAKTIRPLLLQCQNSTSVCTLDPISSAYFGEKTNISTIR